MHWRGEQKADILKMFEEKYRAWYVAESAKNAIANKNGKEKKDRNGKVVIGGVSGSNVSGRSLPLLDIDYIARVKVASVVKL